MRGALSVKFVREEVERARQVLDRHRLPQGIQRFELETDEDQYGDP